MESQSSPSLSSNVLLPRKSYPSGCDSESGLLGDVPTPLTDLSAGAQCFVKALKTLGRVSGAKARLELITEKILLDTSRNK